jgi:hypothetical protein
MATGQHKLTSLWQYVIFRHLEHSKTSTQSNFCEFIQPAFSGSQQSHHHINIKEA